MARVLTKLRIDEVSAVTRGAGEGVRIMLMKRADSPDATPADTRRAFPNPTSFNAVLARMKAEEMAKADDDGGETDVTKAHDRGGPHSLTGALLEHLHAELARRRRVSGLEKAQSEKE